MKLKLTVLTLLVTLAHLAKATPIPKLKIDLKVEFIGSDDGEDKPLFEVEGQFIDASTAIPVSQVEVTIVNKKNSRFQTKLTGVDGKFKFDLNDYSVYSIVGIKPLYFETEQISVSTIGKAEHQQMTVEMPIERIVIGQEYRLDDIVFGINDVQLNKDAERAIEKVFRLLQKNPTLSLEIGIHTDSRGDDLYNLELSQKRAANILHKLQKMGMWNSRVQVKGYGEEMLLNKCANNIRCQNSDHQINRRVSLKVLSF